MVSYTAEKTLKSSADPLLLYGVAGSFKKLGRHFLHALSIVLEQDAIAHFHKHMARKSPNNPKSKFGVRKHSKCMKIWHLDFRLVFTGTEG